MSKLKLRFMKVILDYIMGIYLHRLDYSLNYNELLQLSNDIDDKLKED